MQPIFFLVALAMLALILPAVAEECNWLEMDHATIEIDQIGGGYVATFQCGNCTYAGQEMEPLTAVDDLLVVLWQEWNAWEERQAIREERIAAAADMKAMREA